MKNFYYLHNGRSALNCALNFSNLESKDEILYPENSCDVIFQYDDNQKYNYKFYKTKKNFFVSLNLLKKKITSNTKVIIIINFFGIRQNLKQIYNFCKKNKILLFVDDCHTYYDIYRSNDNDCDIKFFSPSKIFNDINHYGILQVNNKKINIKKKNKIITKNNKLIKTLKEKIKKSTIYSKYKFSKKRPRYEDQNFFKSKHDVKNFFLNKENVIKIKLKDIKKENKQRINNFKFWKIICRKLNIKAMFDLNKIDHGCPLYFPAACNSYKDAIKIFDLGWKNNIEIISWPTLHTIQKKNKKLIEDWRKRIYFPMEKNYFTRKDILSWKLK